MSPGQLAGATVQDSKAKRQERLKSRFRDRGGIFVPAEGNALAQILLERGVNGESPLKRRSPRKSTTTRATPKSTRTAKVATKTPLPAPKRARKSTVAPGASVVDEPRFAPATTKKNKRPSTSTLKTPKVRAQRSRKQTKGIDVDDDEGDDVDAAPPLDSTTSSRPHPAMRPKSFADRLADALNYASGYCPPDPSCLPPKDKAASTRSVPAIKSPLVERRKAPPGEVEAASRCPRGDGDNGSDHSDQPLAQKLAKATSASKSRKKAGTKGTRAKRNAPKAKADTKRAADRPTERTARTSGATAAASSSNSRKRGDEEQRGHEETALPVALPRVAEDLPDDVAPPPTKTKRAGVLQEKGARAPRKRKELAKNVEDGVTVDNEVENGPPEKKRRRADPQNATVASRRRPGKENANGMEPSKPTGKTSKKAMDKPLLSPTGAHRKTTSKSKPLSRSAGTRARPRGLPPDVLRRIKVNAQTLEALQDIDDDDPIDFLRS